MNKRGNSVFTILLVILITILAGLYYFYLAPTGIEKTFTQEPIKEMKIPVTTKEITQMYPNMRFNHNDITYGFHASCEDEKRAKVHNAFQILEEKIIPLTFKESLTKPDIFVNCSREEIQTGDNTYQAGLGGPSTLNLSLYPLIVSGEVTLYGQKLNCDYPVVEIHEILHVFGYEHVNNSDSVMYPYLNDCDQTLDQAFINHLTKLYSTEPESEIFFRNLEGNVTDRYLTFETEITNQGLIPARNSLLKIKNKEETIREFELEDLDSGITKTLTIENLRIPRNTKEVILELQTDSLEYDETNNIQVFLLE
jgi:uncharacterized protein YxeA